MFSSHLGIGLVLHKVEVFFNSIQFKLSIGRVVDIKNWVISMIASRLSERYSMLRVTFDA